jgi:hypothetical protein
MRRPFNPTVNRSLFLNLYALRQQYGAPIIVRRKDEITTDTTTGLVSSTVTSYRIRRAVVLPSTILRDIRRSSTRGGLNASTGHDGGIDTGRRTFIIERRNLPKDFVLQRDDWVAYSNRRYDIDSFEEYDQSAWIVVGKEVRGLVEGMAQYKVPLLESISIKETTALE